jgi:HD-GYP domain-containing protein (c-di-GMP phosphodiesterase class II)
MLNFSNNLIRQLEDNSMQLLDEAMPDVRAAAGPALAAVPEGELRVALYAVMLKIIDFLRESGGGGALQEASQPKTLPQIFLEHAKSIMEYIDGQSAYTVGHTPAVVRHVVSIASRMGLSDREIADLEYAAWIHNIGMINQAHRLDTLARSLTQDELKQARNHTVIGAEFIRPIEFLSHLVPIVRYHHNHFNSGEDIPLGARIIALADAYQAMLEPRAYRPALSRAEALQEILKGAGTQFDPDLVAYAHDLS